MSMLTREQVEQLLPKLGSGSVLDVYKASREAILLHDAALRARVEKADELWRRVREALAPFDVENIEVAVLLIKGFQSQLVTIRTKHQALQEEIVGLNKKDEPKLSSCGHYDCNEADCYGQ